MTAPTTAMMKLAASPSRYRPSTRPSQPPSIAPTMPSTIVRMIPPGSLPGMISLATSPTTRPNTIHSRMSIGELLSPAPEEQRDPHDGLWCTPDATMAQFRAARGRHSARDCRTYSSSRRRHASTTRVALSAVTPMSGKVSRLGRSRSSEGRVTAALNASTPRRFETTKNAIQSARRMRNFPFVKFLVDANFATVRHSSSLAKRDLGLAWRSLRAGSMSLCASCGLQLSGDAGLCPHHHCVYGDDWAVANRIMCDFFHRRKVPPRLTQPERDDDFWAHTGEAA